jgi:NAD-dependent dihydropyrimidine dehydrogenase PreA subunit
MGIRRIDTEKCIGCGTCVDDCPMNVIVLNEEGNKAEIKYLRDCQSCFLCEVECPVSAIFVTPHRERRIPLPW